MLQNKVEDSESVARIVSSEWIVDGVLQQTAFMLNPKETYLSVNRPYIESYDDDVFKFVSSHEDFLFEERAYKRALLSVSDIRNIKVLDEAQQLLNINVEVEPRDVHTKSHAGIFVRSGSTNITLDRKTPESATSKAVSADMVLQEVRWELLDLAQLQ